MAYKKKIQAYSMKYLFWNTHKNNSINSILCDLITENQISILILAEYTADIRELIDLLYCKGVFWQQYPTLGCDLIHILGETGLHIESDMQTDRASFQILNGNTILCCIHLNCQIYSDHVERREIYIEQIISDVLNLEQKLNTRNSIIVGDFNINPYDKSCVSSRYFHGIPIYEETMKESREIANKESRMFYNPMWNFLGDFREPYGTYYLNSSKTVNTFWNIFDQVIIRPVLRKNFVDDNLRIITETSNKSLLDTKKHPDCSISDHLPITFEIKEDYHE